MSWSLRDRAARRLAEAEPLKLQVIAAIGFLFLLGTIGSIAYSTLQGWTIMDGLYMTFITLTTIGFQEVHQLTGVARILTMAIGVVGIITVGFIVTRTTQLLVTGPTLKLRHMQKTIDSLTDHYIICGFGRLGQRIAADFDGAGQPFLVIENAPAKIDRLSSTGYLYLEGNAEEEDMLRKAGLDRAHGIVTTLTSDADNVFVTLLAREINPTAFILARTNSNENARRLYRAGADKAISPYEIGADRMARVILQPNVDRFLEQALHVQGLDLNIEEVRVETYSEVAGKTLREVGFRQRFGAMVVGVVDGSSREVTFYPSADRELTPEDVLIVIGDKQMMREVRKGCSDP